MKAKGKAAGLLCMILTVAYAVYIIPHLLNAGSFSLEREAAAFTFMYYAIPVIVLSVLAFIAYAGTGAKA